MRPIFAVAAVSGLLAGCSMGQDLQGADAATAAFHQRMNAGQYDAIYDAASPQLKASSERAAFIQLLQGLRDRLGDFQSTRRLTFRDNLTTSGHRITVSYASTYARAAATETFAYDLTSSGAVMAAFNVNSPALLAPDMRPGSGATLSPQDASATAVAVADLHRQFNAGQDAAIYAAAAPRFQSLSSQAATTAMFEGFRAKLGQVRAMTLLGGGQAASVAGVRTVVVHYATTFNRGAGTETITFAMEPAGPRLLGYNLQANTHPGPAIVPPPAAG